MVSCLRQWVLEGIRIYNGKVFKLKEHIDRLYQSAKAIFLEIPMRKEDMESEVLEAVKINEKENGYIQLNLNKRGEAILGIDPTPCKKATVIIIVVTFRKIYPSEYYKSGIEIASLLHTGVYPQTALTPV